jgi:uncharacterized membrane protein
MAPPAMGASLLEDRYNAIAGTSAERLAALSDGVFAVAMTLLVLDIRVPAAETIHHEMELWRALVALSPRLMMYVMSFMTLGIFWVGQQTHFCSRFRSCRFPLRCWRSSRHTGAPC